jgi:hypothetical protein
MISGKNYYDEITAKIIKPSTLSIQEKKTLILSKCHDQELQELAESSNLNLEKKS